MRTLRQRLFAHVSTEDGLSLIEIVIAMMIFTIISVGLLYTMMSLFSVTRDSRTRQVATNIAAQEIDLARDINNVFVIDSDERVPRMIDGTTYYVTTRASWVSNPNSNAACGAGGGILRYKRVNITVEWDNMRNTEHPVYTDTLINPNERINDPSLGTIIVTVLTANGEGVEGVHVTATPATGSPLSSQTTDSDGCAFFLLVAPKAYTVGITSPVGKTYVDTTGVTAPTGSATVAAGAAASVPFTYDEAGTFRATYDVASNIAPLNLPTSLISTRDPVVTTTTVAANPRLILVSPWPDGYTVLAGDTVGCKAADPGLWVASGSKLDGDRPEPVAVESATTVDVAVPTSTVTVTGMATTGSTNRYLVAVSKSVTTNGEPSCLTTQTYRFAAATTSSMTVTLPYGSWEIHRGSSTSFTPSSTTKLSSGVTAGPGGSFSSSVVTLDPRADA